MAASLQQFEIIYAKVDARTRGSLLDFRERHPVQRLELDRVRWEYVASGQGAEAILFLHGMTGSYDIWWQQIQALEARYRVLAVTYPAVETLEGLSRGILALLERERVNRVTLIGTSLGGYLAQYLIATRPQMLQRILLGNTFPPNDLIARKNRVAGMLLPLLPEPMVLATVRKSIRNSIYPAAGRSELVLAFLMELSLSRMSKAQFVARYRCVVDRFVAANPERLGIPLTIVESDNDPLVEPFLREKLKATYPHATIHTLQHAGHFPYLNEPERYTHLIESFLQSTPTKDTTNSRQS